MSDTVDHIIRLPTVMKRTGLSRSTIYRKVDQGTFPRPIKLSTRCVGWRASSIKRWSDAPIFYEVDENGQ